nr:hypothetical protein OH826_36565 [Streptomyces sp. NBC_00899]
MEPLMMGDPAQVGPYQLTGRLGANELGQAYAGRHPAGASVTVTVLHPHLAADPQVRARFRTDVNDARRAAGPYVLPVDADTEGPAPWVASAGPDVATLATAVTGLGPLPPNQLRDVAVALTGALAGAQQAGVRLAGLEPSAVFMTPEGPRLAPFGIAHAVPGAGGGDPDAVYSLGAALYFAATGRPPAPASAGWQPGPPPIADPVLGLLIADCLSAQPGARPTVHDLLGRLNGGPPQGGVPLGGVPMPGAPAIPAIPAQRPWWRDVPASVVATAVTLALFAVFILTAGSSGHDDFSVKPPAGATATGLPSLPSFDGSLPSDGSTDPGASGGSDSGSDDGSDDDPSDVSGIPSASPTQDDPIATAQAGDCFDNSGTEQTADLTPTVCAPRTFKVVQVLQGTTATSGCDRLPGDDWNVSYSSQNLVLCLSYQYENGTAYHATAGTCVYGDSATSDWDELQCQTGAFTVQQRITGTTDGSRCKGLRNNDWAEHFGVSGRSDLDVTLCLSMVYPDDAGHAVLNQCMHFSGSSTHPALHAAKCGSANVIVTGRTPKYNDSKFCGNDAWATWRPNNYPELSYTLCYRYR